MGIEGAGMKEHIEGRKKSANFSLRLSVDIRKRLQLFADREGVKPAFIVRKAIERYIRGRYEQEDNIEA